MLVAPACEFGNEEAAVVSRDIGVAIEAPLRCQDAAIKKRAVRVIAEAHAEFQTVAQVLVGRADAGVVPGLVIGCAQQQRRLAIPHEEVVAGAGARSGERRGIENVALTAHVPVPVRPVGVAGVPIDQEVINHVVHVDVVGPRGIVGAVRIQTLGLHQRRGFGGFGGSGGDVIHQADRPIPRHRAAFVDGGAEVDAVPLVFVGAEIVLTKAGVGPLSGIEDAPIDAVDVKMHEAPAARRDAEVLRCAASEFIAGVLHIGAVAPLIAVVRFHADNEAVELLGRVRAEERVAQLGGAVDAFEKNAERLFERQAEIAKRPALNADAAVELEVLAAIGSRRVYHFE